MIDIMLKEYLLEGNNTMTSGNLDINKIQNNIRNQFLKDGIIKLNFKDIRAISPSFAYKCFGHVFNQKKDLENLLNKLEFENDNFNFENKIKKAIKRRISVLS